MIENIMKKYPFLSYLKVFIFFCLASPQAWAGSIAGNGGGLSEQGILFSWEIMPSLLKQCLAIEQCSSVSETKELLDIALKRRIESDDLITFRFEDFSSHQDTLVIYGNEILVDSNRIYPNKAPIPLDIAFRLLMQAWLSNESLKHSIEMMAEWITKEPPTWGLSQYQYPEIRLIQFEDQFYFQDSIKTHNFSALISKHLSEQFQCPNLKSELKVTNLDGVAEDALSDQRVQLVFRAQIQITCPQETINNTSLTEVSFGLALDIKNGTYLDLIGLQSKKLNFTLNPNQIQLVIF